MAFLMYRGEMDMLRAYLCGCVEVKCYLKIVLVRGKRFLILVKYFLEFALSVSNISLIEATSLFKTGLKHFIWRIGSWAN